MYDATYFGLHQWNKSLFEKLGWMILAFKHKHYDITDSYIINIKNLHKAIDEKIRFTEDKDTKNDLMTMKRNVEILLEHCEKDFNKKNLNKRNNKINKKINNKKNIKEKNIKEKDFK